MVFLVAFAFLLLLSTFSASWRLSLLALGLQALTMGAYLLASEHQADAHHGLLLGELILVKGLIVPIFLFSRFKRSRLERFIDLIPANLVHWTIAGFFVAFSYLAAAKLSPASARDIMSIGAAFAAISLGMLTLASQSQLPGQLIAILTIENGISLFTLGGNQVVPWQLELFIAFDFVILVVLAGNFLARRKIADRAGEDPSTAPVAFGDIL